MKNHLVLGDYNTVCDCCGMKFKASQMKKRWDGVYVCSKDFEFRHQQDLLRVKPDSTPLPWTRPDSDLFLFFCVYPMEYGKADYGTADCAVADKDGTILI